jgi:hypothetical protein
MAMRKKSTKSADVRLWSRAVMGNLSRKKKVAAHVNERNFPFVVQIAVPDDGFGSKLDAINAWHRYSKSKQRRGRPQFLGKKKFWRWCFTSLEIAEKFRQRFGGEIVLEAIKRDTGRKAGRGLDKACGVTNERSAETTPCS